MLERTIDLLADDAAAGALRRVLLSAPLAKPADHRGPPDTDMFIAVLDPAVRAAVLVAVSRRAADKELAGLLNGRSPAGFVAAWREFAAHRQASGPMAMQTGCNRGGLDDDRTDRRE